MACARREITGWCNHYQCPFTAETSHGDECVELIKDSDRTFCEVGDGCLEKCPYSFGSELQEYVTELFRG